MGKVDLHVLHDNLSSSASSWPCRMFEIMKSKKNEPCLACEARTMPSAHKSLWQLCQLASRLQSTRFCMIFALGSNLKKAVRLNRTVEMWAMS